MNRTRRQYQHLYIHGGENVEKYTRGGYHPISIGDTLVASNNLDRPASNNSYRVLKKLDFGDRSTVWLAKDNRNTRYVTLKILGARDSRYEHDLDFYRKLEILQAEDGEHAGQEHFVKLFDTFVIQGPNGAHRCLVLELMGPNLIDMLDENEKYLIKVRKGSVLLEGWQKYVFPHAVVKGIARQVLSGIAYLHSRGITLGGVYSRNIMVELPDISHLDEGVVVPHQPVNENSQWTPDEFTDLPDDEGPPQQAPVKLRRGGRLPPWAPRFIIAGQPLRLLANANQNPNLSCKLGGFGQATWRSTLNPRAYTFGLPLPITPPDVLVGLSSRANEKTDIFTFGCEIFRLITGAQLTSVCGYFTLREDSRGNDRECQIDEALLYLGDRLGKPPPAILDAWGSDAWGSFFDEEGNPTDGSKARSWEEILLESDRPHDATQQELEDLVVVLRAMLQYMPQDRESAENLLKFRWFASEGGAV